jgi:hypothetical protein
MRIFVSSPYRKNALPDGEFEPWMFWWHTVHDRP